MSTTKLKCRPELLRQWGADLCLAGHDLIPVKATLLMALVADALVAHGATEPHAVAPAPSRDHLPVGWNVAVALLTEQKASDQRQWSLSWGVIQKVDDLLRNSPIQRTAAFSVAAEPTRTPGFDASTRTGRPRPSQAWYDGMIRETVDDDFTIVPLPAAPVATQAERAAYSHADVTDAHSKGYALGLSQVDRATRAAAELPLQGPQMTNDRIQQVLAMAGSLSAGDARGVERYVNAANSLLSALARPSGAISIADEAAWELIQGKCRSYTDEPSNVIWYETQGNELRLALDGEDDIFDQVSNAVSYLVARGLLVSHPDSASLVSRRERP